MIESLATAGAASLTNEENIAYRLVPRRWRVSGEATLPSLLKTRLRIGGS